MFLKHHKKLIEINEAQAIRIGELMDKNKKIPLGLERLDPHQCEIFEKLPYNYQDYEVVYQTLQIETSKPDYNSIKRTPEQIERNKKILAGMKKALEEQGVFSKNPKAQRYLEACKKKDEELANRLY